MKRGIDQRKDGVLTNVIIGIQGLSGAVEFPSVDVAFNSVSVFENIGKSIQSMIMPKSRAKSRAKKGSHFIVSSSDLWFSDRGSVDCITAL